MKKESLIINSHVIHTWQLTSAKPSILLIHGIGVSSEYYVPFMNALAPNFDVHSIDLPGYGTTPKPKKPLSIRQLADIVNGYAEATGKRFILVGQSMGSQIITHAAAANPDRFTHLILVAPTTNHDERSLLQQGFRLTQDIFHESFAANRVVFRNYIRMGMLRYIRTAQMMVTDHIEETIAKVAAPIIIVTGESDKIAPLKWTSFLAGKAPSATTVVVKDAPHLIQFAMPNELARITRKFTQLDEVN